MMSQRAAAKYLGISRTLLQIEERRALVKLALALGLTPRGLAPWMALVSPPRKRHRVCARCKRVGHFAKSCAAGMP